MPRLVVKNTHQIDTCYDETGPCAQIYDTMILSSIANITIGKAFVLII